MKKKKDRSKATTIKHTNNLVNEKRPTAPPINIGIQECDDGVSPKVVIVSKNKQIKDKHRTPIQKAINHIKRDLNEK